MKDMYRFAAVSCAHCPLECEASVKWALKELANMKKPLTDFVFLGDLFESGAACVHPNEYAHTLEEEYAAGAALLARIQEQLPKNCRRWWLLGNHDDNLQVQDKRRIPKELRDMIHWNRHDKYGPVFRGWTQLPYEKSRRGCLELGPVIFMHGYDCGVNSDELEAVQAAMLCGGHAHRLIVRGHTHAPQDVTQCRRTRRIMLPFWYTNAGTLGPLKPLYMARKDSSGWGPGMVIGEASVRPKRGRAWHANLVTP
jgi:predicted phosphodiesterase